LRRPARGGPERICGSTPLPSHDEFEISVSIQQTPAGTALDDHLRREQTRAVLALLFAHQDALAAERAHAHDVGSP
jgi:hypothetical protein